MAGRRMPEVDRKGKMDLTILIGRLLRATWAKVPRDPVPCAKYDSEVRNQEEAARGDLRNNSPYQESARNPLNQRDRKEAPIEGRGDRTRKVSEKLKGRASPLPKESFNVSAHPNSPQRVGWRVRTDAKCYEKS